MRRFKTDPRILSLANGYLDSVGLPRIPTSEPDYVRPDPAKARNIASAYDALPSGPPATYRSHHAYQSARLEIRAQFRYLVEHGMRFFPCGSPGEMAYPYDGSDGVIADARNGQLWVYTGGDDHPFFSRRETFEFRAIHDVLGHALHGYSFGPRGEENAWRAHARMFSLDALPAMTAETRGQNSWVNFGPHADVPAPIRPYAEQKANVMDSWAQLA